MWWKDCPGSPACRWVIASRRATLLCHATCWRFPRPLRRASLAGFTKVVKVMTIRDLESQTPYPMAYRSYLPSQQRGGRRPGVPDYHPTWVEDEIAPIPLRPLNPVPRAPAAPIQEPHLAQIDPGPDLLPNRYDKRWAIATFICGAASGAVAGAYLGSMLGSLWGSQSEAESVRITAPAGVGVGLAISAIVVGVKMGWCRS